jgi:uncharacterized membrane protein YeaQ/YmgE (transglycosylase-associated protein family)
MIGAIIGWIIIGAIAGVLGKLIMPGRDPGGFIITILLGIAGAFVGGFIMQSVLGFDSGGFIWSILVATLGAVILLAIYRAFAGGSRRRT